MDWRYTWVLDTMCTNRVNAYKSVSEDLGDARNTHAHASGKARIVTYAGTRSKAGIQR